MPSRLRQRNEQRLRRAREIATAALEAVCQVAGLRVDVVNARPKLRRHTMARRAVLEAMRAAGWGLLTIRRVVGVTDFADSERSSPPLEYITAAARVIDVARRRDAEDLSARALAIRDEQDPFRRSAMISELEPAGHRLIEVAAIVGCVPATLCRWARQNRTPTPDHPGRALSAAESVHTPSPAPPPTMST